MNGAIARRLDADRVTDLPSPWSDEPYLLGEHALGEVVSAWVAPRGLVLVMEGLGRDRGLFGVGSPVVVAGLLDDIVALGGCGPGSAVGSASYATLARGTAERLAPGTAAGLRLSAVGSQWDWMWTTSRSGLATGPGADCPAEPRSDTQRLPLGPRTAAEVGEFLSRGHPTAGTAPDDPRLIGWWGVRRGERLVAAVGAIQLAPGMPPHLVSLGVDPRLRGQGLAGAVMAAAVDDCLKLQPAHGPALVSLGLYASNDVARRVYERLGFELRHSFTSWSLDRDGSTRPNG